jgi:hypothetical protein
MYLKYFLEQNKCHNVGVMHYILEDGDISLAILPSPPLVLRPTAIDGDYEIIIESTLVAK